MRGKLSRVKPRGEDEPDWLSDQLAETQRLIANLRREPASPKQQLAIEQLVRVQVRLLQALSEGEPPSSN